MKHPHRIQAQMRSTFGIAPTTAFALVVLIRSTTVAVDLRELSRAVPTRNPAAKYALTWTDNIKWTSVVCIDEFRGGSLEERLDKAQAAVAARGGGVVYFPPGVYKFENSLRLKDGLVIRGAEPKGASDARKEAYNPPTRFEFPKYVPTFEGKGTPIDTAFKGLYLEYPETASNCGVVNIAIDHGHIDLQTGPDHKCGRNRLVYGCLLRNAAVADPQIPHGRQYTHVHGHKAVNLL